MLEFLCNWFGHKWRCYMACDSYCKRCGITYTDYYNSLSKKEQEKLDKENKEYEEEQLEIFKKGESA